MLQLKPLCHRIGAAGAGAGGGVCVCGGVLAALSALRHRLLATVTRDDGPEWDCGGDATASSAAPAESDPAARAEGRSAAAAATEKNREKKNKKPKTPHRRSAVVRKER